MKMTSSAFENNGLIPTKYTCDSENINPPLILGDIPEGTQSLVLIMEDPDVPKSIRADGLWNHWLVWDIIPNTTGVEENSEPKGTIGKNTGGDFGYSGPCPPDREHRYFFKLHALDTKLNLNNEAKQSEVEQAMVGHILTQTQLIGRYNRT
ncbi:MAG: YbhB/YbcL family Raf kinase inhibitor-like protein [bacterium]|nr:YbhB/YbcL family Raf kinase inhibitor-like protein [bacterium]